MSLNIVLQNDKGKRIDNTLDLQNTLVFLADRIQLENNCCMRFIDPYGDTIFNRMQMTQFIMEIDQLMRVEKDPEQIEVLS